MAHVRHPDRKLILFGQALSNVVWPGSGVVEVEKGAFGNSLLQIAESRNIVILANVASTSGSIWHNADMAWWSDEVCCWR
jgi:hypothetical protein